MQVGDFEVTPILDGYFCLDAGSIFGVVPRVVWEKKISVDELHRIRLAVRCLLVRNDRRTILIDSGQGNKQSEKFRARFAVEQSRTLIDNLRAHGVGPEDVTDVINCHLHFDHAGWNTIREKDQIVPTFPNAHYWSQRREWERAHNYRRERDQGSFLEEDFLPLEQPRWKLIEGERNVIPGVEMLMLPGHTLDTQGVLIHGGDKKIAFLGDLIPTKYHVPYAWIAAFDLFPTESLTTKRRILPRAVQENWTCVFGHDPDLAAGRLREGERGNLEVIPAEEFQNLNGEGS